MRTRTCRGVLAGSIRDRMFPPISTTLDLAMSDAPRMSSTTRTMSSTAEPVARALAFRWGNSWWRRRPSSMISWFTSPKRCARRRRPETSRVQALSPTGDRKSSLLDEIFHDFYQRTGVDLRRGDQLNVVWGRERHSHRKFSKSMTSLF